MVNLIPTSNRLLNVESEFVTCDNIYMRQQLQHVDCVWAVQSNLKKLSIT